MHDMVYEIMIHILIYIDTTEWPFNLQPHHKEQIGLLSRTCEDKKLNVKKFNNVSEEEDFFIPYGIDTC